MTISLGRHMLGSTALALSLVALLWFALAGVTPALAGGVVGSGLPASCDEAAFTARLGGSVSFNCGGPNTIVVVGQKTITQSTTIDGGGIITLTGGLSGVRLFHVSSGVTLTLRNILLDSFLSSGASGGTIANDGTLVLDNTTIQFGLTDINHGGGAIFSNGPVYIANSLLRKNSGGFGGGAMLLQNNADTRITNSRFEDNRTLNLSGGYGGAIWVKTGTTLTAADSRFERNRAQFGGAVYVEKGAAASFGGQLTDHYTALFQSNLVTTTNSGNPCSVSLPCSGGAIYSEGDLDLSLLELYGNQAQDNLAGAGLGGAVASYGTLHTNAVSFAVNRARFGGGLAIGELPGAPASSAGAILQESSFQSNTASRLGGGFYTNGYTTTVTATHSIFLGNSAGDSGGGVMRVNARLAIIDSTFLVNQAVTAGGGLYASADSTGDPSNVFMQSSTFDGNQVTNIGSKRGGGIANGTSGAFFPNGGVVLLEAVTLISNTNGIFSAAGDVHTVLHNVVLANGPSLNCDSAGTAVTSNGHNFSSDTSCALGGSGDQQGSGLDPQLGPSQCDIRQCYRLPLAGSPLIDSGSACPPRDQRGASRIGVCDKGAVEFGGLWRRTLLPLLRR